MCVSVSSFYIVWDWQGNRLARLHGAPQRSTAAWQKQCILVRTSVQLWSALQPPYDRMCHQSTERAKRDQSCSCSKSAAALMKTHFIPIGQILWWQSRGVLHVYSYNSIPIMLTNLCFYNSKSFFSVVALLSWVIFIKNTDKSIYPHFIGI